LASTEEHLIHVNINRDSAALYFDLVDYPESNLKERSRRLQIPCKRLRDSVAQLVRQGLVDDVWDMDEVEAHELDEALVQVCANAIFQGDFEYLAEEQVGGWIADATERMQREVICVGRRRPHEPEPESHSQRGPAERHASPAPRPTLRMLCPFEFLSETSAQSGVGQERMADVQVRTCDLPDVFFLIMDGSTALVQKGDEDDEGYFVFTAPDAVAKLSLLAEAHWRIAANVFG
jgi:hypothetical protein